MDRSRRVIVLGGRIAGSMAAAYVKRQNPDLEVVVIDRGGTPPPLVGESTIELTNIFLRKCGLAPVLDDQHFHKYGLTFYFKLDGHAPSDRRYSIHEEPAIPPLPANLVNRWTLDRDLVALNESLGVHYVRGKVTDVEVKRGAHRVVYQTESGEERTLEARWIFDATGRRRFLAKKLSLHQEPPYQRSTFWFRLADFDRNILIDLNREMRSRYASMREQIAYDPYFVTHHFMGDANWIWLIPIASEDQRDLISIGITWRPDLYPYLIRNMADFMEYVAREHPVVTDFTASGEVLDTNVMLEYMSWTRRHYSEDGWFIIGDAADTSDPLYSSGLAIISMQVMQATAIIAQDRANSLDPKFVDDLETFISKFVRRTNKLVSTHYDVMGDPYQSHLRMHWTTHIYFYFVLPFFLAGYHTCPKGVQLMIKLLEQSEISEDHALELFEIASKTIGAPEMSDIVNWYQDSINYRLLVSREDQLPVHLSRMLTLSSRLRLQALRKARWRDAPRQLRDMSKDMVTAALLRTVFRKERLRDDWRFQRMLGIDH